jgi:hypothetical protein
MSNDNYIFLFYIIMIKQIIAFLSNLKCKLQCCFKSNCSVNDSVNDSVNNNEEINYKFSTQV